MPEACPAARAATCARSRLPDRIPRPSVGIVLGLAVTLSGPAACSDHRPTAPELPASEPGPEVSRPGAPGPDASAHPHQPAGFEPVTERSFRGASEDGWSSNSALEILSDPSAPRSPGSVGVVHYPAGFRGGTSPVWSRRELRKTYSRLYVTFWVKLSEGWQGHSVGDKIGFFWTHGDPVVVPFLVGAGSAPKRTEIRIQDVPDGARNLSANVSDVEIERGRWHRWEVVVAQNTGDRADGEVHWWIDGRKAGEYRNVRFGTAGQEKRWSSLTWRPIWGGLGDRIRAAQSMSMDHFYASGAP